MKTSMTLNHKVHGYRWGSCTFVHVPRAYLTLEYEENLYLYLATIKKKLGKLWNIFKAVTTGKYVIFGKSESVQIAHYAHEVTHGDQLVHHSTDKSYDDKIDISLRLVVFGNSNYLALLDPTPTRVDFFPYLLTTSPNNRFESFLNCPLQPPSMKMARKRVRTKKGRQGNLIRLLSFLYLLVRLMLNVHTCEPRRQVTNITYTPLFSPRRAYKGIPQKTAHKPPQLPPKHYKWLKTRH